MTISFSKNILDHGVNQPFVALQHDSLNTSDLKLFSQSI